MTVRFITLNNVNYMFRNVNECELAICMAKCKLIVPLNKVFLLRTVYFPFDIYFEDLISL